MLYKTSAKYLYTLDNCFATESSIQLKQRYMFSGAWNFLCFIKPFLVYRFKQGDLIGYQHIFSVQTILWTYDGLLLIWMALGNKFQWN